MNVEAFGAQHTVLAAGCKGTVGDGSCYFDEFLKHIFPAWKGSTTVGTNLSPDVDATAKELAALKPPYTGSTVHGKLFPGDKAFQDAKAGPQFPKVMQTLGNNIRNCRVKLGDNDDFLNCRKATSMVHAGRVADQAHFIIEGVNKIIDAETAKLGQSSFVREMPPHRSRLRRSH